MTGEISDVDFETSSNDAASPIPSASGKKNTKPCENCRKDRRKCVVLFEVGNFCERCQELGLQCRFAKPLPRKDRQALLKIAKLGLQAETNDSALGLRRSMVQNVASRSEVEMLQERMRALEAEMQALITHHRAHSIEIQAPPVSILDSDTDLQNSKIEQLKVQKGADIDDFSQLKCRVEDYLSEYAYSSRYSNLISAPNHNKLSLYSLIQPVEGALMLEPTESPIAENDGPQWQITLTKEGLRIYTNIRSLNDLHGFVKHGSNILGQQRQGLSFPFSLGKIPHPLSQSFEPGFSNSISQSVFYADRVRAKAMLNWFHKSVTMHSPINTAKTLTNITAVEASRWLPHLLNYYLNVLHPLMPIVSKAHLLNIYNKSAQPITFPFFCALSACLMAVLWSDKEALPHFPSNLAYAQQLSHYYFVQARMAIEDGFDTPSIYNVLTLVCLRAYRLMDYDADDSKMYISHATRLLDVMELAVGTRSFSDTADMEPAVEKELFTRARWVTFSMPVRSSYLHRRKIRQMRHALQFYEIVQGLDPPRPLEFEDAASQLCIRAYAHVLQLSKCLFCSDDERAAMIFQVLVSDREWDADLCMLPIDQYLQADKALAEFYDNLEDDLKWGHPFDTLTDIAIDAMKPCGAKILLMQQFYHAHLWRNIRILPADLSKLPPPTSSKAILLQRALQTSVAAANNVCAITFHSAKHDHESIDYHGLLLVCELLFSVSQLSATHPKLAEESRRQLIDAVTFIRSKITMLNGGNVANYTIRYQASGAFYEWLKGARIYVDVYNSDESVGNSMTPSSPIPARAILVSWLYKPLKFPFLALM
ncbi:hypothetical protein BZG36_05134 [Bifiguratus adelaidae]|uniref:Zn(2)-C6 fungal-type domain-containing protein n=1 Tax=Bifiguratus adelaidae TaxID=1938954 RepID=A0A261XVV0_9FUNG|nr:hypothetical protein BZG36_05134 [Bifiguratus adelaidae]